MPTSRCVPTDTVVPDTWLLSPRHRAGLESPGAMVAASTTLDDEHCNDVRFSIAKLPKSQRWDTSLVTCTRLRSIAQKPHLRQWFVL